MRHFHLIALFIGYRPFGVSLLYMGWDRRLGFQLYQSDPSGNYSGWKATCIGNNSVVRKSLIDIKEIRKKTPSLTEFSVTRFFQNSTT